MRSPLRVGLTSDRDRVRFQNREEDYQGAMLLCTLSHLYDHGRFVLYLVITEPNAVHTLVFDDVSRYFPCFRAVQLYSIQVLEKKSTPFVPVVDCNIISCGRRRGVEHNCRSFAVQ